MQYTYVSVFNDCIIDYYYDNNGTKRVRKMDSKLPLCVGREKLGFSDTRGLHDEPLEVIHTPTIKRFYKYINDEEFKSKTHGNINPVYQYISHYYTNDNFTPKIDNIRIFIIDIEVLSDEGFPDPEKTPKPLTSIAIKYKNTGWYYVCSTKEYDKQKTQLDIDSNKIKFHHAKSEEEIFRWLIALIKKKSPDVIVGWNSNGFDFPYIINRSYIVFGGQNKITEISPHGELIDLLKYNKDRELKYRYKVGSIYFIDYMTFYKKFIHTPRESYALDFIATEELGEEKLNFDEYDNLNQLWIKNPQKYIDYNIYDVELISMLEDKHKLLDLAFNMTYKAKCLLYDCLGTIRIWDVIIYNKLKEKGIMVPPYPKYPEERKIPGGYVKEPIKDIHGWMISIDLDSLYPHIQQQFNISPDCKVYIDPLKVNQEELDERFLAGDIEFDKRYILSANGCYYRKDKEGVLPEILKEYYAERKEVKKKLIEKKKELQLIKQQIAKIEAEKSNNQTAD